MRSSVSRTEALLLLLAALVSPLAADAFYESNPLSQKIRETDGLSGNGWELSATASGEVLYFNGRVEEKKTFSPTGYTLMKDGRRTEVTLDAEGRPLVLSSDNEKTVNTYSDTGRLVSTVVTVDGEIRSLRKYFYSYDGTGVRTDGADSIYIFSSDDFYYSLAEEGDFAIRRIGDDLYVRDTAEGTALPEIEDTGDGVRIKVSENESMTWDRSGNISGSVDEKGSTRYFYEDDVLVREERTAGDTVETLFHENGRVVTKETRKDGEISSVIRYSEDGSMKKEMYRKGRHYATVSYDRDGSTVLDVEMH